MLSPAPRVLKPKPQLIQGFLNVRATDCMKFSIIIPAYNEEQYLPRLLDSIDVARDNYSGGPVAVEVIVADNDSSDRTAEIAAARGARVVKVAKRRCQASHRCGAQRRWSCGLR